MTTILRRTLLLLLVWLQLSLFSFSQSDQFSPATYVKMLSDKSGPASSGIAETLKALEGKDSITAKNILNEIESKGNLKNNFFKARILTVKGKLALKNQTIFRGSEEVATPLLKAALNAAYETGNDSLISEVAWNYGELCVYYSRIEAATMYLLFAAELDEKIKKVSSSFRCLLLGAVLYKTRDYRKAINYTLASIQRESDTALAKSYLISRYNTIGICYQRMNVYDSAFMYFETGMKLAHEEKSILWQAIISGNKGQIYYAQKNYSLAKQLLLYDYNVSKTAGEFASSANSLQWVARINLTEGKKDSALLKLKEALDLVDKNPDVSRPYYLQNIYFATADAYRSIGKEDSVLKYSDLYNIIHDSIVRSVADSRLEISRIKLDNLQNELAIKNLHKQKKEEEQKRNFIIALIILSSIIALLYLNSRRLKHLHREQLAQQEKAVSEESARQQLELLTQSIIEKTSLIEKLESQIKGKEATTEQQLIISELSQQTILTEDDWNKFKALFEKLNPGFFINLKNKFPDSTLAEQRMAALTRLRLTTKQIASMLGISVDSVHKSRQRLRQRFQLSSDENLDESVSNL